MNASPPVQPSTDAQSANASIEKNLQTLGYTGAALLGALVVTLVAVQFALSNQLDNLQSQGVESALVVGQLNKATSSLHGRQTEMFASTSADELAAIPSRAPIEAELRAAVEALGAVHSEEVEAVRAEVDAFLQNDAALYASVEERHRLHALAVGRRGEVEAKLRALIEAAGGLAGVARLENVLLLRRLKASRGGARVADQVVYGPGRAQQEAGAATVEGILQLIGAVGKLGLTSDVDSLNSVAANVLPQNESATRGSLDALVSAFEGSPEQARAEDIRTDWAAVFTAIGAADNPNSLYAIQRGVLEQHAMSEQLRGQASDRANALQAQLHAVDARIDTMIAASQRTSDTVVWLSYGATGLLMIVGLWSAVASRKRIVHSLEALQTSNTQLAQMGRQLTEANEDLEAKVEARTAQLAAREAALRLVMDSTGDGLVRLDLEGRLVSPPTAAATRWLGEIAPGSSFPRHLMPDDAAADMMLLGIEMFQDGFMPFEVVAGQMPTRVRRGDRVLGLSWRPIEETGELDGLLLVLSDETTLVAAEEAQRKASELQQAVGQLLRNPSGFRLFLEEVEDLLAELLPSTSRTLVLRHLHTIKGNCLVMGFPSVARVAHHLEDVLAETETSIDAKGAVELRTAWDDARASIEDYLGSGGDLDIDRDDVESLLAMISRETPYEQLMVAVRKWDLTPARVVLGRLKEQTLALSRRLDKEVEVVVQPGQVRLEPLVLPFFGTLVHVIRNAIDHGIEAGDERQQAGKNRVGTIRLAVRRAPDELVIEVGDDGGGIDWEAVRGKAERMGLPHRTHADLVDALFADQLSTRDEVSELSGRGVGLSAVRGMVHDLDGSLTVDSTPGMGTSFTFRLPSEPAPQARPNRAEPGEEAFAEGVS